MILNIKNEPILNRLYESYGNKKIKSHERLKRLQEKLDPIMYGDSLTDFSLNYCKSNNIKYENEKDAMIEFTRFKIESYKKIFENFHVYLVGSKFEEEAKSTIQSLLETADNKSMFELLGKQEGILVLSDTITAYSIKSNGSFFMEFNRYDDNENNYVDMNLYGNECLRDLKTLEADSLHPLNPINTDNTLLLPIIVLILMKYAEIKSQLIAPGVAKVSHKDNNSKIINKTPFQITQVDCSWNTNYIRTEGYTVKGFMRWQACGPRWSDRKLIYVEPYKKGGYIRRAKMLTHNYAA